MACTVVGVFDDYRETQTAADKLEAMGIDLQSIRVSSSASAEGDLSSSSPGQSGREPAGGIRGFFASLFGSDEDDETSGHYSEAVRRGSAVLTVNLSDDSRTDEVREVLESCGAIDIDERVRQWQSSGYTGYDANAEPYSSEDIARERQKLPVVQEELKVGKRTVGRGGVRIHRRMNEQPVEEELTLREEHAVVERTPVDRPATSAELDGGGRADVEIRETAEEPVVSKTARVVEEVSVSKRASERKETIRDTVRRADVDIERLDDGAPASPMAEHLRSDDSLGLGRGTMAAAGGYSGPERRRQAGGRSPSGVERRAAM